VTTRVLFVCSQNKLRSPTAERVFSQYPGLECESAGTDATAQTPLEPDLLRWADVIFVMERSHKRRIATKFKEHLAGKRVVVLDIPDEYDFMDEALVRLLRRKVAPLLQLPAEGS
jgi:predicted protein tyrosine phosphatase